MAFPSSFLDEIRARLTLSSVVGRRVRLVRKGRESQGLCPFHNEKTPSFTLNDDKGFFHCFGCGAHGDVIGFEMRAGNLSFPEAVERLAAEAGLEVPRQAPEERERAKRAASLLDAMEAAAKFYEGELRKASGRSALDYLTGRGLDEATITRFRLGWSPDSRNALKRALAAAQIPEPLSIEAGLLIVPDGGGESYDRFRGRVMFPILDSRGRVIAFGGRTMGDGQPKYLNSPDTPLFQKGSVLYGLALAREASAKAGTVIVAEGYMDVIALARAGFGHAVAPLGTALTERQIELLWRLAPEPVVCLDGDAAGQRAAARAADRVLPILKPGHSLRFALLPSPEDPDSLIKARGPEAMRDVLGAALPLSDVMWRNALGQHATDTPERRALLEKDLMDGVERITDRLVRDQYRREMKDRLWREFRRPQGSERTTFGLGRPLGIGGGQPKQEQLLLLTILAHPPLIDQVGERLGSLHFAESGLDRLRQEFVGIPDPEALDSEGLQLYLGTIGLTQTVETLLSTNAHEVWAIRRSADVAKKAAAVWEDAYKRYRSSGLEADIREAETRCANDPTEGNYTLLAALQQELQSVRMTHEEEV